MQKKCKFCIYAYWNYFLFWLIKQNIWNLNNWVKIKVIRFGENSPHSISKFSVLEKIHQLYFYLGYTQFNSFTIQLVHFFTHVAPKGKKQVGFWNILMIFPEIWIKAYSKDVTFSRSFIRSRKKNYTKLIN